MNPLPAKGEKVPPFPLPRKTSSVPSSFSCELNWSHTGLQEEKPWGTVSSGSSGAGALAKSSQPQPTSSKSHTRSEPELSRLSGLSSTKALERPAPTGPSRDTTCQPTNSLPLLSSPLCSLAETGSPAPARQLLGKKRPAHGSPPCPSWHPSTAAVLLGSSVRAGRALEAEAEPGWSQYALTTTTGQQ